MEATVIALRLPPFIAPVRLAEGRVGHVRRRSHVRSSRRLRVLETLAGPIAMREVVVRVVKEMVGIETLGPCRLSDGVPAYRRQNRYDPFSPIGHDLGVREGRVLHHGNYEYVVSRGKTTVILQHKGDVYRPVAAFGNIPNGFGNDGTTVVDWDALYYHPYKDFYPSSFVGHVSDNFIWTDKNGDNLVQPDEMQWI